MTRKSALTGIATMILLAALFTGYATTRIGAQEQYTSLTTNSPAMPTHQAQGSGVGWNIQIRSNRSIPHVIVRFSGLAAWHMDGPPSSNCDGGERVGTVVPVTAGDPAWDFGRGTNSTLSGSPTVVDCTVYLSLTPVKVGRHSIKAYLYSGKGGTGASGTRDARVELDWRGTISPCGPRC